MACETTAIVQNVGGSADTVAVTAEKQNPIVDNIPGLVRNVPAVVDASSVTISTNQPLTLSNAAPGTAA